MGILSHSHVGARSHRLLLLTVLAAVLYLAAGLGLAYVVGFGVAYWAAERYRARLRRRGGWRQKLSIAFDATHLMGAMFRRPVRHAAAISGMLLYWLGDMWGLWMAIAAFGLRMNAATTMVAFGTAMIVTRRTGPLGGAGILCAALAATLWYCGAPWTAAVLGTFSYRFFAVWLPQPLSFLMLPRLERLLESSPEPALQR